MKLNYFTSVDAALFPVAVLDVEYKTVHICCISKTAYSMGIEDCIYIHFVERHLCGRV